MIQGSDEWHAARCGSIGGSRLHEAIAKTKSGWGASRANLAADLIIERLTHRPTEKYVTDAMRNGTEQEPRARSLYEFMTDETVETVGLIKHPDIAHAHYSPDGLVGKEGLIEIKAPLPATHLKTLLGEQIDRKYLIQMMWGMTVTGRQWCDFISYCDLMPVDMQLYVRRVRRDPVMIVEIEREVRTFLSEIEDTISKLRAKFPAIAEAA